MNLLNIVRGKSQADIDLGLAIPETEISKFFYVKVQGHSYLRYFIQDNLIFIEGVVHLNCESY